MYNEYVIVITNHRHVIAKLYPLFKQCKNKGYSLKTVNILSQLHDIIILYYYNIHGALLLRNLTKKATTVIIINPHG